MNTIASRIASLPMTEVDCPPLPVPSFTPGGQTGRIMLAWHNFSKHMTNEGWQLQEGLREAGYELCGRHYPWELTSVPMIATVHDPGTVVVQDKREWDSNKEGCFEKDAGFEDIGYLRSCPQVFRVAITKDAHQDWRYHKAHHEEIGAHAWITYYHTDMVCHLAPWIRREHVVRTYHSLNSAEVPEFRTDRSGCLLSGALSEFFYPLRTRLARQGLPDTTVLPHPGYNANGWQTPGFLRMLSRYKVVICTSSIFGYALRKPIEATACGCVVITDLPEDEVMPGIDGNFIRVSPDITTPEMASLVIRAIHGYDPERQADYAERSIRYYDYRRLYGDLSMSIENLRSNYVSGSA